jgi:hypothetical protein
MCQHCVKTAATAVESRGGVHEYRGFGWTGRSFSYSSMDGFGRFSDHVRPKYVISAKDTAIAKPRSADKYITLLPPR